MHLLHHLGKPEIRINPFLQCQRPHPRLRPLFRNRPPPFGREPFRPRQPAFSSELLCRSILSHAAIICLALSKSKGTGNGYGFAASGQTQYRLKQDLISFYAQLFAMRADKVVMTHLMPAAVRVPYAGVCAWLDKAAGPQAAITLEYRQAVQAHYDAGLLARWQAQQSDSSWRRNVRNPPEGFELIRTAYFYDFSLWRFCSQDGTLDPARGIERWDAWVDHFLAPTMSTLDMAKNMLFRASNHIYDWISPYGFSYRPGAGRIALPSDDPGPALTAVVEQVRHDMDHALQILGALLFVDHVLQAYDSPRPNRFPIDSAKSEHERRLSSFFHSAILALDWWDEGIPSLMDEGFAATVASLPMPRWRRLHHTNVFFKPPQREKPEFVNNYHTSFAKRQNDMGRRRRPSFVRLCHEHADLVTRIESLMCMTVSHRDGDSDDALGRIWRAILAEPAGWDAATVAVAREFDALMHQAFATQRSYTDLIALEDWNGD